MLTPLDGYRANSARHSPSPRRTRPTCATSAIAFAPVVNEHGSYFPHRARKEKNAIGLPVTLRKLKASAEIWGKLTGSIDTRAKFEARRMALASSEWQRMKDSDSRECRNCHSFEAMSGEAQKQTEYRKHMKARDAGKTCIDCHKGVAHQLPKEYEEPEGEN